jgi:hypothetical protein
MASTDDVVFGSSEVRRHVEEAKGFSSTFHPTFIDSMTLLTVYSKMQDAVARLDTESTESTHCSMWPTTLTFAARVRDARSLSRLAHDSLSPMFWHSSSSVFRRRGSRASSRALQDFR